MQFSIFNFFTQKISLREPEESFWDSGFAALMSAIVISFLLLSIATALGFTGIYGRFNLADSESKERSNALTEACVEVAVIDFINGVYSTNKVVNVGMNPEDFCTIVSITPSSGQNEIKTKAIINKTVTNLKVVIDDENNVISWDELPNF